MDYRPGAREELKTIAVAHTDLSNEPWKPIGAAQAEERYSVWTSGYFALLLCLLAAVVLVAYYVVFIKPFVFLPADILMWAESNFVGDIIKLRIGSPIYTAPQDSNSMIYTPGAPLLTYAISLLVGKPNSIVTWRAIQLGFVFCAAVVATVCCQRLRKLVYPDYRTPFRKTWLAVGFLAIFLACTAPNTNRFAHALHADALALLLSMLSFLTVLVYLKSPSNWRIALMAACPAVGYLTKQFLVGWAAVMFVLLLLHNPRNIKRLALFTGLTVAFIAIAIGSCYLIWGDNFIFWTFNVMGGSRNTITFSTEGQHISLARSVDHLVRAWLEIGIGVVGGLLLFRDNNIRRFGPVWIAWIALLGIEALSSGAGWGVLYHFGPGVVIGVVFLFAALPRLWPSPVNPQQSEFPLIRNWTRALTAFAGVLTVFVVLHVVPTADPSEPRNWRQRPSPDIYRYISDIEREFDGLPPDKVLLDVGNWIYLGQSVLAKDRGVSLGDQPCNGMYENFDVLLKHIQERTYAKILVRDLHSPRFIYDWEGWPRSSGVRDTLLKNYAEVRIIPAPASDMPATAVTPMHTGPVSVLVPR
jgi:hypothetical protein